MRLRRTNRSDYELANATQDSMAIHLPRHIFCPNMSAVLLHGSFYSAALLSLASPCKHPCQVQWLETYRKHHSTALLLLRLHHAMADMYSVESAVLNEHAHTAGTGK